MSRARRRGLGGSANARVTADVAGRLRDIRALWCTVNNDPAGTVADLAPEFFFAVGEILEGRDLKTVTLRKLDRARALRHAAE